MDLEQSVIDLHAIARAIEQQVGPGNLSDDVRQCANRLAFLIKERNVKDASF
jgi:hypothetical protein